MSVSAFTIPDRGAVLICDTTNAPLDIPSTWFDDADHAERFLAWLEAYSVDPRAVSGVALAAYFEQFGGRADGEPDTIGIPVDTMADIGAALSKLAPKAAVRYDGRTLEVSGVHRLSQGVVCDELRRRLPRGVAYMVTE